MPPVTPPPATAEHVAGDKNPTAYCISEAPIKKDVTASRLKLYTRVMSKDGPSFLERRVRKEKEEGGITEDLMTRTRATACRALTYAKNPRKYKDNSDAHYTNEKTKIPSGQVNFTTHTIKLEGRCTPFTEIENPELRRQLYRIAGELQDILGCRTDSDPSVSSNRSLAALDKPLNKTTESWAKSHTISANRFDEKALPQNLQKAANKKIEAAEIFIENFRAHITKRISEKKRELNHPLEQDQIEHRKKLRSEVKHLEEIASQLNGESLDKKAIFWSVAFASDNLDGLSTAEQMRKANESSAAMKHSLDCNAPALGSPTPTNLAAYSNDVGDLLIHDRGTYQDRIEDRGEAGKGTSIEEFVVYNILNLSNSDEKTAEAALSSLKMPKRTNGIRIEVLEDLAAARKAALKAYKSSR